MLSALHVEVRRLKKAEENVLYVVAHIARFRKGSGVGNGEGHFQNLGQSLGEQGLAGAGGAQHQDIALLELHVLVPAEEDALVMIIHRHG